jgi:hypothetical protein
MTTLHEPEVTQTAPERQPPATGRIVGGILIIAAGLAWLAERLDLVDFDAGLVLPGLVVLVGIALLASWRDQTHGGLIGLGVVLSVVAMVSTMAFPLGPIGDQRFAPTDIADLPERYEMTAGNLLIDLSDLEIAETTNIMGRVGFGRIDVVVPDDVRVVVEGHAMAGQLHMLGSSDEGLGLDRRVDTGAESGEEERQLVLDLSVVAGEIHVTEVNRG